MKPRTLTQTFNDGVAKMYEARNIAEDGDLPKYEYVMKIETLCYEERTVGMTRFWAASQENTKIDLLLRFPRVDFVFRDDIVVLSDGKQYGIKQIQYPPEVEPKCMDLSLERLEVAYEL